MKSQVRPLNVYILLVAFVALSFGYKAEARKLKANGMIYVNTAKNMAVGAAAMYTGYKGIQRANQINRQNQVRRQQSTTTTPTRRK